MERHRDGVQGWTARRGDAWIDLQPILDRMFLPIAQALADTAMTERPREILDIGCGTGATTLALAGRVAPRGSCTGIDVSAAMLEVARQRAVAAGTVNARFIADDAQRHRFVPGSFDAVVSRFGVMFFDDPAGAFANIRTAIRTGGMLTCFAWRSREENPFMTAAERAAAPILGEGDRTDPLAPGQFAFADADRVTRILTTAGWHDVAIGPVDIPCTLSNADLATYVRRMGRIGMILPDLAPAVRDRVTAALDRAFAPFVHDGVARFDAACWRIRARAG